MEITGSVIVADTFYDLLQRSFIVRIFTVFYPVAYHVAHDTTEVVMTCI